MNDVTIVHCNVMHTYVHICSPVIVTSKYYMAQIAHTTKWRTILHSRELSNIEKLLRNKCIHNLKLRNMIIEIY